ncbi:MAG: hypothetical protein N4A54_09515 [Peptostreptococcaceae bacterium]|jgi:hypothetical protein|nr:hypothetical protein [Peptostreptococcaceae bacterium]
MLEIKVLSNEEFLNKKDLFNKDYDLENTMFILEKNDIVGYLEFEKNTLYYMIKDIETKNDDYLLKDGLVKSMINYIDLNGVLTLIIKKHNNEDLIKNLNFKNLMDNNLYEINDYKNYSYINAVEFFSSSCNCCKGKC